MAASSFHPACQQEVADTNIAHSSQLNPILCYSVAEAEPPADDAYTIPGLEQYRAGIKRVFNAMLFHHPVTKFPKRGPRELKETKTLFPKGIKCGGVVAMIRHYHPKLKGVLSNGNIGHHLQFLESQIMMRVLRCCREGNIVALPVFDCVVVRASAYDTVSEIMQREFKAVSGLNIAVKLDLPALESNSSAAGMGGTPKDVENMEQIASSIETASNAFVILIQQLKLMDLLMDDKTLSAWYRERLARD